MKRDESLSPLLDGLWGAVAAGVIAWTLLAVLLARWGWFTPWVVLPALVLSVIAGWIFFLRQERTSRPRRSELIFLVILVAIGLLLFARPAEHFPQTGDASIYPNTAAMLLRTGGLTYHYAPLDGLSPAQKQLFYIPSDEQLPTLTIQSYRGLLYGAYYVMDPAENTVVSSRPTGSVVWMALFGGIAGPQAMLYVTPLFGVASLITVYLIGRTAFDRGTGALAAVWLLLSFPQLHFSQRPYAEVIGQFFVLAALLALLTLWQTRRLRWGLLGIAALTAAFATRIDVILVLAFLIFYLMILPIRFRWRETGLMIAASAVGLGYSLLTLNRPYVGATAEILLAGQVRFLRELGLGPVLLLGMGGLALLAGGIWLLWRAPRDQVVSIIRWTVPLAAILGVGYALHIRPLFATYTILGGEVVPTHNAELMPRAAQYLSPLFFWLAALGVGCAFRRRRITWAPALLLVFVLPFAGLFFWKYTTARVYPVALRRLLPEVLPVSAIFGAFLVRCLKRWPQGRWGAFVLAGLLTVLLVTVSGPYWFHTGMEGAWRQIEQMADQIPQDGIVLFEHRQEGSIASWFASPLWSFHQRSALLLEDQPDGETLRGAICTWQSQGREVYIVANQDPSQWWPGLFQAQEGGEIVWSSSMVGQSLRFPPYIWRFRFPFSIYYWYGDACSAD